MDAQLPETGVVAVVADERIRGRLAGVLRDSRRYGCRLLDPSDAAGTDWEPVDVLVVDWNLPAGRRDPVVQAVREAGTPVGILAVFSGVPEADPIAGGADHEVQLPTGREAFLTEVRVTHLQVRYARTFDRVGRATSDDPDSVEAVERTVDRADEALSELSEHVSYVDLFRRLIDE